MKKLLRVLGYLLAGLVGFVLLAAAAIHGLAERKLGHVYEVTGQTVPVPSDPSSIAEGERLATIRGCNNGCHGEGVSGEVFFEQPLMATVVAPDLTRIAANHTDAELERVIRQGVRTDGTSAMIMPADMFHFLTDEDLGMILAFIRSRPVGNGPETVFRLWPLARFFVLKGDFPLQAETVATLEPREAPNLDDPVSWGRYLARTSCTECHGNDFNGTADGSIPDLRQALGYDLDAFKRLLREGVPLDERELDLMRRVARGRFSHFTDPEVEAVYAFLQSRGGS